MPRRASFKLTYTKSNNSISYDSTISVSIFSVIGDICKSEFNPENSFEGLSSYHEHSSRTMGAIIQSKSRTFAFFLYYILLNVNNNPKSEMRG